MNKLVFVIVIVIVGLTSCSTTRTIPTIVEHTARDTLYISNTQYDSIYIDNWQYVEHKADTIFSEKVKLEYRYKLLRDTIRIVKVDSIPVIRTVTERVEVKYTPWYTKALGWVGAIAILIILIYIFIKIKL